MISARDRPWVALCSFRFSAIARSVMISAQGHRLRLGRLSRFSAIARSVMISATGKARASNGLWRSFSAIARSVMISA